MVTHRKKGMKSIDIFESDYEYLSTLKMLDKPLLMGKQLGDGGFFTIADVVEEIVRGYHFCIVEKKYPVPRDENEKIIVEDFK